MIRKTATTDGDTFKGSDRKFYRLANVDTPEKNQRGFLKAKNELDNLLGDDQLVIDKVGTSYGRIVADVRKKGEKTTINTKMRRKGY